jgi:macrolide-specific efflux system membrane fusion protein
MTAEVHIVLGEARNVLIVPAGALANKGADNSYVVQVVEPGGGVTRRTIKVGLNNKIMAEVISGLKEGERVVTGQKSADAQASRMPGPPPMGL